LSNQYKSSVLLTFFALFIGYLYASAQVIIDENKHIPFNYQIKVKQFNEFIDRFNYERDFLNQDIGPSFSDKITRQQYIGLLFDHSSATRSAGVHEGAGKDTLIRGFIQTVCRDSVYIDKYSELVYAELKCRVTINEKSKVIYVLLKQEIDHGLKWSIVSVQSNDSIGKKGETDHIQYLGQGLNKEQPEYIPPLSNETNFMVLKKILTNSNNLGIYSAANYNPRRVIPFYYAVSTDELKFKYVESIAYFLFDVPGWTMNVRNFQRDTENSGWLIANIERISGDSFAYFKEKYGLDRLKK
jgi:hypothetical protein